jgi:hypothetical protein
MAMQEKGIVKSATESISRISEAKKQVAANVDSASVSRNVRKLTKPGSPSSALKKAGVALIVGTPDPITAVPGVALIATSYVAKRKDPAKLDDLAEETRKILRDIQSFSL